MRLRLRFTDVGPARKSWTLDVPPEGFVVEGIKEAVTRSIRHQAGLWSEHLEWIVELKPGGQGTIKAGTIDIGRIVVEEAT